MLLSKIGNVASSSRINILALKRFWSVLNWYSPFTSLYADFGIIKHPSTTGRIFPSETVLL